MASIKYDFNSCYDTYDFLQFDSEQLTDTAEDVLKVIFTQCEIEAYKPKFIAFPDPVKLLTTCRNKTSKTLPASIKSINFNKTQMAKHLDIELNTALIFKSTFDMMGILNSEKACRKHLEQLRWNDKPICPHCGSQRENHYRIKTRGEDKGRYKCKDCRLPFSVTIGTVFKNRQFHYKNGLWQYFYLQLIRKG